tara:strand:- start:4825 stop:5496 length:672 start_codon:yes stop_codon:yes gene_type:complete
MTIFLDAIPLQDLSNYDGLKLSIAAWLERDDLTDKIPYFIKMAEARFRRVIRNPERETDFPITPAATIALPADFDSLRLFRIPELLGDKGVPQVTPAEFYKGTRYPGNAPVFTIMAGQIRLSPLPSSETVYTGFLDYIATIPGLGGAFASNWLLAGHPDLYLYASLLHAEFYGWNDDRLPLIKGAVDEMLAELSEAGIRKRYGPGPLVARPPVYEPVRGAYRR